MFKKKVSVLAGLLVLASSAMAANWTVSGKISGTPHDLGGTTTGDNGELCVYCHTPHAAQSAFTGAPLWNKSVPPAGTTYLLYGAQASGEAGVTIAGTAVGSATGTLSSPSLACLSCHDGVSAINSIVNAPGSGMQTITGDTTITQYVAAGGFGGNIGGGTTQVDMSNDHPVSVPYTVGAASLKATDTVLTNWVGADTIAKLLRGPVGDKRVECSSCHDPHNGYATNLEQGTVDAPQVNYLRHTNAASALCLGCHDK